MKRYIRCSSGPNDVFMLMEYSADIGPDTTGMDGDEFYCLGKFYANSLEEAKQELAAIKEKYPWLKDLSSRYTAKNIYVDNYNSYFDYQPEDEDDIDMNPSAMGGVRYNIFSDLETLIEYLGLDKNSGDYDDVELPFEIDDFDPNANPEEGFNCRQALKDALIAIEVDPDYEDLADIAWDYNMPNGTYEFEFFFDDGDSFKHTFDLNEIMHCDSVREAAGIIENSLHKALKQAGK